MADKRESHKAFQILPFEVNENIAIFCDTDKDVINFSLVCRETHRAVDSRRAGVWRARYKHEYDLVPGKSGNDIRDEYMKRCMYLRQWYIYLGLEPAERKCLKVLKQLIIESFAGSSKKQSLNIVRLRRFFHDSSILSSFYYGINKSDAVNPMLQAIHACLAHWILTVVKSDLVKGWTYRSGIINFPISQMHVYSKPSDFPIFKHYDNLLNSVVNFDYVIHSIKFWRFHLQGLEQHTLHHKFKQLSDRNKPQAWKRPVFDDIEKIRPLSSKWKGTYAYLPDRNDVIALREAFDDTTDVIPCTEEMLYVDEFDENGLHIIDFDFCPDHNTAPWPEVFESHLKALPSVPLCIYNKHQLRSKPNVTKKLTETKKRKQCEDNQPDLLHACEHISKQARRPSATTTAINPAAINPSAPFPSLNTKPANPTLTSPRLGTDYLPFCGAIDTDSSVADNYQLRGILHPVPPQRGIPGFQRISFMKYKSLTPTHPSQATSTDSAGAFGMGLGGLGNEGLADEDDAWCYEGVVLPGGHMILGRYWSAMDDDEEELNAGPFIMWAVEE